MRIQEALKQAERDVDAAEAAPDSEREVILLRFAQARALIAIAYTLHKIAETMPGGDDQ